MEEPHPLAGASKRQAVALRYRKSQDVAPRVTASGQGRIADAIIKRAKESGITLMEDPDLVNLLSKVPVGDTIPLPLYKAVAEVLAYVYRINKSLKS
ncbi:EscU/YscU/HrcU family type III secretion system export apparatus switch protein [Candidatus Magnetaquicoccus inordinatus]|uniref:EscU/YscU/HrcU family type III secretion system export apparatus switch protein n=1 Tax=Candidatus Magnetaquicoccus inordinatus TaxID=2496818 RepID=UPI00102ADB86|nr:EscU/YscU/HrcU family type III secretion system export apparatus switch protein [Candidatus Magnetaquicoccus inordinatus]